MEGVNWRRKGGVLGGVGGRVVEGSSDGKTKCISKVYYIVNSTVG